METISRTLEIDGNIEEIEIDVNITHYLHVPPWRGSKHTCPSDEDWYGYTNLDHEIVETYRLTELGEREKITLNITPELEGSIYDELIVRAANYRERDVDDEPLCYFNY